MNVQKSDLRKMSECMCVYEKLCTLRPREIEASTSGIIRPIELKFDVRLKQKGPFLYHFR